METKMTSVETQIENEKFNEMFLTGFGAEHLDMKPNPDFL